MASNDPTDHPEVDELEQDEQEGPVDPRPKLDPDELTPADMRRARKLLGRNPYEYIGPDGADDLDTEDRLIFIMWCIRSRTQPDLTWEQASVIPFGEFAPRSQPPDPQTARRTGRGSSPTKNAGPSSPKRPTG